MGYLQLPFVSKDTSVKLGKLVEDNAGKKNLKG